ncbi:hypothetical protein GNI_043010 [Gregarina niphandrodes]|uniref:Uncharacterized protein n=1 Tax=Gregarina niphandrodes TaxID=110365 RepID=A0A023BA17_GRENI|nr:hypothetical protein GNI_043010 [Gregarina niphandrodes]EZG77187.1 hypothetical protein GNI_043010 [Gregarina niphandrodes]|eukprot:XP_011129523.1 hypothetical protein GNI_043010 [Gregarina niphandrodes]
MGRNLNYDLELRLMLQPTLRIAGFATEDPSATIRGELLGLEVSPGVVEVSNCYAFRSNVVVQTPTDGSSLEAAEEKLKKEAEKYQSKMRDLLEYVDCDPQPIGIWVTNNSNHKDILEELWDRCHTYDPNSVLLSFDSYLATIGRMPFKAFLLSPQWFSLRHQLETGELDKAQFTKKVNELDNKDLLTPIKVTLLSSAYTDAIKMLCAPSLEHRVARDLVVQEALMESRERELAQLAIQVDLANNN